MEYRFSLTPRLIALAIFSGVALLILLFTLGFQIGQRMASPAPTPSAFSTYGTEAKDRAAGLTRQASGKVTDLAASIDKPTNDQAFGAPKAAP
jgi:ABC-type multidrug transport system fused ATPase/permease subunit